MSIRACLYIICFDPQRMLLHFQVAEGGPGLGPEDRYPKTCMLVLLIAI